MELSRPGSGVAGCRSCTPSLLPLPSLTSKFRNKKYHSCCVHGIITVWVFTYTTTDTIYQASKNKIICLYFVVHAAGAEWIYNLPT